jgi:hypothetical protein
MIRRPALVSMLLAIAGCAIVPNSVRPEFEHMSHATQHFGADQTNYGSDTANLIAHWDIKRAYLELAEGVSLDPRWLHADGYGETVGPREQFSARIGYVFQVKP